MKLYLAIFMFALLPAVLFSRDITTLSGTAYKDAKVCDSNEAELTISYLDKARPELTIMKSIPFTDLPDEIRKEFKYDPVKAEALIKARKEAEMKKAVDKMEKKAEAESPGEAEIRKNDAEVKAMTITLDAPAIVKEKPPTGRVAPGEKNGQAEVNKMTDEATAKGIAPGEKNGAEESDKIREDAR